MEQNDNRLGRYLKERRARLDPAAHGFPPVRRRTRGLRREEVAQLAHVSATWYTWLEQGRGGAPSADVLDRLARAFALDEAEREHLFLLAQHRPPRAWRVAESGITPQLQRVLDTLVDAPAVVKTPDWTVIAWNRAATMVLADFPTLAKPERNVLRTVFRETSRDRIANWEEVARLVVATVRRDVLRAGLEEDAAALVEDLSRSSADFRRIWADQDVRAHGEGVKRLRHPSAGWLTLEFSTFAVDGRPDHALVVFNPATDDDRAAIRRLIGASRATS